MQAANPINESINCRHDFGAVPMRTRHVVFCDVASKQRVMLNCGVFGAWLQRYRVFDQEATFATDKRLNAADDLRMLRWQQPPYVASSTSKA